MSTQAQSSSPFSRLSRLAFPFKSSQSPLSTPDPRTAEDWYIPYHGPLEPPKDERNTDSWGHLVSGWLMENEDESRSGQAMAAARRRVASNASRMTGDDHRGKGRAQTSFIKLDQAGGVGDVPAPVRPRRSQEAPVHHRASLASIWSFGKQKGNYKLHHSPSVGSLRDDLATGMGAGMGSGPMLQVPQDASARLESNSHSQPPPAFVRRHPYAYAIPATSPSPAVVSPQPRSQSGLKFSVKLLDPLPRQPSAPAYLLPARRPSRLSLKASMSTPNLRAATGTGPLLPKGKQRWLSAETWCDALILPRPRFALRIVDGESGSGRIVSPPGSPIWPPGTEPTVEKVDSVKSKSLKKSRSAVQLRPRPDPPSPPHSFPTREEPQAGPSTTPQGQTQDANTGTHLKPHRPKSWALDDLAIPSPVPSLAKVLEDGRKLEEDRRIWQEQASRSFDRRAGTISRARSKSIGARTPAAHSRTHSTFDVITEATLLGSQKRRPTVHVRVRPPRSDGHATSSGGGTNTITGTGTATFTSGSHGHGGMKARSHGHSNSLGTISQTRSDEWAPGHGRNHSLGRTALRVVRATASTAAGLCGINPSQNDSERNQGRSMMNEKAAAMEEALRSDGTKVIHLRDQVLRDGHVRDAGVVGGVVVITPPPDSGSRLGDQQAVGPGGTSGVSPTPSSAEGIGIAISTPMPTPTLQENPFEKEPIWIPHPYAQSSSHPYYSRQPGRAPIITDIRTAVSEGASPSPVSTTGEDGVTKHRQPIKVHPYSPYAQVQHPYAAITGTNPGPSTTTRHRPNKHVEVRPSPLSSMFAELSPGTIREIMPDEIQYSPYIPTPPVRFTEFTHHPTSSNPSGHPYGPSSNRMSELHFADALSHTFQRRNSTDSGVGTSETHEAPSVPEPPTFVRALEDSGDVVVISPNSDVEEELDPFTPPSMFDSRSNLGERRRPVMTREMTGVSNHTLASSPLEYSEQPIFRQALSVGERSQASSGSSPGGISTHSSPPLSPRPIHNSSDDLERFRDLFYRPPESITPSSEDTRPPMSRQASGSIPIELNARSTRSLSGLTTLARQISISLEEMQDNEGSLNEGDRAMWGTRHGGLAGRRPSDFGPDPSEVLSQSSSRSGYRREETQSPLRLPIDEDMVLSQPVDVIPEDVQSSRASSMLVMPFEDNLANVRIGEIEAVSTPSVSAQPQRFSTHLTEMDYHDTELSPTDSRSHRVVSGQSSLGAPVSSDPTRSSFMTNTSGMSRLSDFPAPPSQITAGHLSILHAYYGDGSRDHQHDLAEDPESRRPGLVREPSQTTFGGRQMGEAL